MEVFTPRKYDRSRLDGILIRQLNVYEDGRVSVVAEDGHSKDFWMEGKDLGHSSDLLVYGADSMLCHIQDDPSINVSKY